MLQLAVPACGCYGLINLVNHLSSLASTLQAQLHGTDKGHKQGTAIVGVKEYPYKVVLNNFK